MIFGGTVLEKQFTLTPDESYPCNIQRHVWKTRTSNSVFDPHEATLRDIDNIYEKFNFPENPLSNAEPLNVEEIILTICSCFHHPEGSEDAVSNN